MDETYLNSLKEEAMTLTNRLDVMTDKSSENYEHVMHRLQELNRMIKEESERLAGIRKMEMDNERLELDREKFEVESQQKRLQTLNEETKLKQARRSNYWDIGKKILGGVVTVGVNLATVYVMIRFNNSGENLTNFEQKFINPSKFIDK